MDLEVMERGIARVADEVKSFKEGQGARLDKVEDQLKKTDKLANDVADRLAIDEARASWREAHRRGSGSFTIGKQVATSPMVQRLHTGEQTKTVVSCKSTLVGDGSSGSPQSGFPVDTQRLGGIHGYGIKPLGLMEILPRVMTTAGSYEFVTQGDFTENAGYQAAQGNLKNQSRADFQLVTANIATIAHFIKASKQVLADADQLQSHVDLLMTTDVRNKAENELLWGAGGSGQIFGVLPQASSFDGPGGTLVDEVAFAIATLEARGYSPTAVVMSPLRWAWFLTQKDSQLRYQSGNYTQPAPPTLWNRPVVVSSMIDDATILVGDFARGARLVMREEVNVQIGYENDDFTRNIITILAEMRLGLALLVPAAFLKIQDTGSPVFG